MCYSYCFGIRGTDWLKFGSTDCASPWKRARKGFYTNKHPRALCKKLGYDDLDLLAWCKCPCKREEEQAQNKLRESLGLDISDGEFYELTHLGTVKDAMKGLAIQAGADADDWCFPLIPKPIEPPEGRLRLLEMLSCCTGEASPQCPHCAFTCQRDHQLKRQLAESCPVLGATSNASCAHCGSKVNKRLMGQHFSSQKCKRARGEL